MAKQPKSISTLALTSAIILGVVTVLFTTCGIFGSFVGEDQNFLIAVWSFIPAAVFSIYPLRILFKWIKGRKNSQKSNDFLILYTTKNGRTCKMVDPIIQGLIDGGVTVASFLLRKSNGIKC